MYNFSAGSKRVLSVIALFALLGLLAVESGKKDVKLEWFNEKLDASILAADAVSYLKEIRMQKGIFIDAVNDPNETALMGQEYTLITTDRGDLEAKLTSTNPNFAAVIVELLKEANLKNVVFKNANLAQTDIHEAQGLTLKQLLNCKSLYHSKLPQDFYTLIMNKKPELLKK